MKKSRVAAIFATLSLSAGITIVGSGSADAAMGDRHFILISTHGAPRWNASATLHDGQGNEVYRWNQEEKSGGRVKWDFTDGGDGGKIKIKVEGIVLGGFIPQYRAISLEALPLDRDHCFLVGADGVAKFTGDSIEGGCNAD